MFFGGLYAYNRPLILTERSWQFKMYRAYHFFVKLQLIVFFSVLFVDLEALMLPVFGLEFTGMPMTQEEASLDIIVRVSQVMCCTLSIVIGYVMFNHQMDKRKKIKEANRVLDGFKKARRQSYAENRESETPTQCVECSICLGEFNLEDQVMQLSCHHNHIYHRDCLQMFLENARDGKTGPPKCPLCQ